MPRLLKRLPLGLKALHELGAPQLGLYALYQLGLRSGHYRRLTASPRQEEQAYAFRLKPVLRLPDPTQVLGLIGDTGLAALHAEADEIVAGQVRLFGGAPVALALTPPAPLHHWTAYEGNSNQLGDLKFIWEPARFGWAFTLGRAYWLTQDEGYPAAFWRYAETFLEANPAYQGPHWLSAQEVALRLCGLVFAAQVFASSLQSTPARLARLAQAVIQHAARIPPTLVYARAQNNNHLISEALGLYTAAAALPDHPLASRWRQMGWKWLNRAFQHQIAPDGSYCQHSTNYHRLMLQAALWAAHIQHTAYPDRPFPPATLARLQAATTWYCALLDPISGQVPNLGPNDGACIFPLSSGKIEDHRPVVQAAARAFLSLPALPRGPWDELSLWHGLAISSQPARAEQLAHPAQSVLRGPTSSWAYLRAARFTSRPGHADQLHLDLWWRGINVALDPGTYRYTAEAPWDNALTSTLVHNTLSVDGLEQMTRAGRFLYLDWAQASPVERTRADDGSWERLRASHAGYRRLGITHLRQVTAYTDGRWLVEDDLNGPARAVHTARLHWLLPDFPWEIETESHHLRLVLTTPEGLVSLSVHTTTTQGLQGALVRAGQLVYGKGVTQPTWGWTSPTYGDKIPALAIVVYVQGSLPLQISSEWILPDVKT